VEKYPRLVELINGITDWLINLNIPFYCNILFNLLYCMIQLCHII